MPAALATLGAAEHRGIAGKSSGGYGAMVLPMLRPDVFGAFALYQVLASRLDPGVALTAADAWNGDAMVTKNLGLLKQSLG